MNEHISLLQKAGLTELEAKIYSLLLTKSGQNGNKIANSLSLDRSTIYRSLKSLSKKGLIVSSNESYNCQYSINDINALDMLIKRKLIEAKDAEKAFSDLISILPNINASNLINLKFKVLTTEGAIKKLYTERNVSEERLIREISSARVFPGISDRWWHNQIMIRRKNKSFLHQIIDRSNEDAVFLRTNKAQYKEVRRPPSDLTINAGINIFNDIVSFHNPFLKNPTVLIIEDKMIAGLMRDMFDFIWSRSELI